MMRRRHRTAHRRIWAILAMLLPLALLGALALRRNGPLEASSVRLPESSR
jgi:hypothetical protein